MEVEAGWVQEAGWVGENNDIIRQDPSGPAIVKPALNNNLQDGPRKRNGENYFLDLEPNELLFQFRSRWVDRTGQSKLFAD